MKYMLRLVLFGILALLFNNATAQIEVGDKAPLFKAKDDEGKTWNLKSYIGKKNVVLYFYPAAMTGGCTKQACAYRDDKANFDGMNAVVVGLSGDEVKNLKIFADVYDLNFPLLADEDGTIAKAYGVPVKDGGSIEREYKGGPVTMTRGVTSSRWTFIIDKKGKVAYINKEVNASEDSKEVMAVLKKL
ncbi:peroxiredoxin [Bacteroidota bacterium]